MKSLAVLLAMLLSFALPVLAQEPPPIAETPSKFDPAVIVEYYSR